MHRTVRIGASLLSRIRQHIRVVVASVLIAGGAFLASSQASAHELGAEVGESEGSVTFTIHPASIRATLSELNAAGYDVLGVDVPAGTADIRMTHEQAETFRASSYGTMIESEKVVPGAQAPDQGYLAPDALVALLQQLQNTYPNLAEARVIGRSGENRPIWALKITQNVRDPSPGRPALLLDAQHHAREIMTPEVLADAATYLLQNYGQDARVTQWLDNTVIWLVPSVNPDGAHKVWGGSSMWRKNTRGGYGVDNNRNYAYLWGACNGSSTSTWAQDYRGPSGGSEPETQAVMALVREVLPVISVTYHSYSELVLYPEGCQNRRAVENSLFVSIGQNFASRLVRDAGIGTYTHGTPWELLYPVDGDSIGWQYHEYHVLAYAIEVNSSRLGFSPPYLHRNPTVVAQRPGWQGMLDRIGGSGIRGHVLNSSRDPINDAVIQVANLGGDREAVSVPLRQDGTFHLVLAPGMYHLSVRRGAEMREQDVIVNAQRQDVEIVF